MKHQLTNQVKLLHKVVIFHKDTCLLIQRASQAQSRPKAWDLPGGNSEWPEKKISGFGYHQADIVREIQEETGLSTNASDFTQTNLIYFHTYFDITKDIYTIICGWTYQLDSSPVITLSHEHLQYQWVQPSQIDSYDFGGQSGQFIKDIINNAS